MIRQLTFQEILESASHLPAAEQAALVTEIQRMLDHTRRGSALAATWADVSAEGLARAYGHDEPEYSDRDIPHRPRFSEN
ncbi:MAG: hypothetical protein EBT03_11755 [Betaproteobacteria bacterium]|nr:hypothetical protein [Betaproteobacteria bacterium]